MYVGAARIERSEPVVCPAASSCPAYSTDRHYGLEARIGFDPFRRGHVQLGPVVWWIRSLGGGQLYQALGLGLRIGYK
jgi:hypothetical protein